MPVAALPERPGWGRFIVHSALTLVILIVGLRVIWWVFLRYSRQYGSLPIRPSG